MNKQAFVKLLEMRIWHDYSFIGEIIPDLVPLSYNVHELIEIVPSQRTQKILKDYDLLFKTTSAGFIVLVRLKHEDSLASFTSFEASEKLTFYLYSKHPYFSTMTNLPQVTFDKHLLYFNNLDKNILQLGNRNVLHISKSLPAYDPDFLDSYKMGEVIRKDGKVWEVIDIPPKDLNGQDQEEIEKSWAAGKE